MKLNARITGAVHNNETVWKILIFNHGKLHSEEKYLIPRRMTEDEMMAYLVKIKEYAKTLLLEMGAKQIG